MTSGQEDPEPVVWTINSNITVMPAMNLYTPQKRFLYSGAALYVLMWLVIGVWFALKKSALTNGWIAPLIGFITGAYLLYTEYALVFSEYDYVILPDKHMYKLKTPITINGKDVSNYQVVTSGEIMSKNKDGGYIMSLKEYEEGIASGKITSSPMPEYLESLARPMSSEEARSVNFPQVNDAFDTEMSGLSMSAYYLCITMITWVSYAMYATGSVPPETLALTILSIVSAVISSIPFPNPRSVLSLSKNVFMRRLGVHVATAFAAGALVTGFLAKRM